MSLEFLSPFAGRHAVQSAAFGVHWATPISDDALRAVGELHEKIKADFPSKQQAQRVTFSWGGDTQPIQSTPEIGGLNFIKPIGGAGAGSPARSLQVQDNFLMLAVNDYDRWAGFAELIKRSFEALMPTIAQSRSAQILQLQYTDTFFWRGKPGTLEVKEIFREGSKFLAPNVFSVGDNLWHSFHGFFSDKAPKGCRLLENINVQRTPNEGSPDEQLFTISTNHQLFLDSGIDDAAALLNFIAENVEQMHKRNKEVLAELLTDEVQQLIALWGGK